MKRTLIFPTVAMSLLLAWVSVATAGPIAPMLPLNDFGKKSYAAEGKTVADAEKELPTAEEVGIPAYPGSRVGMSGESNGVLSMVQLLSQDSPDKVIAWYKEHLDGWLYAPNLAVAAMDEVGVFVKTDKKEVDAFDSLSMVAVRIRKIEKKGDTGFIEMAFDVKGYKTLIDMTIKPVM